MNWTYSFPSTIATYNPTGLKFKIEYMMHATVHADDIDHIKLSVLDINQIRDEEVEKLELELREVLKEERRRLNMRNLISKKCNNDNFEAALVISKASNKKVTTRTIQAWLAPIGKISHRTCPEWALNILLDHVAENLDGSIMIKQEKDYLSQLHDNKSVELANNRIEANAASDKRWSDVALHDLPKKLAKLDRDFRGYLNYLNEKILDIESAFGKSDNFEDLKKSYMEMKRVRDTTSFILAKAQDDIENNKEEFSTDDGVRP